MNGLEAAAYRDLLEAALPEATDADTLEPGLQTLFTPDSHRRALYVDSTLVLGGRGVGKTFWYRSLLSRQLREVAAAEYGIERLLQLKVSEGYGASIKTESYPGARTLRELQDSGVEPFDIWHTVLIASLGQPEFGEIQPWKERVAWTRSNPEAAEHTVQEADRRAQNEGHTHLILFDALEHLHRVRSKADQLVSGILELALYVRLGTRNIRCKVFIRPDMLDDAILHFPDASKLTANAASLTWSRANLYGLLFHRLGNQTSKEAEEFRVFTQGWTTEASGTRHLPSASLRGDEKTQERHFAMIAGPYMGANYRKGNTYTWLPNHLMDGVEQVSPRSFLSALSKATSETRERYADHDFAIHHEGIRRGVQTASETRVREVNEDIPWVSAVIRPLVGQQVPIEQEVVERIWDEVELIRILQAEAEGGDLDDDASVLAGPRHIDSPGRLIDEMIGLGVMRRRRDGRIDLPDVYRIAFNIGRKGGVPRVAA